MNGSLRVATIAMVLAFAAGVGEPSVARNAPDLCRAGQNDPAERPAPDALLPRLGRTFGVAPSALRGASYVRCAGGHLMGCMVGANLDCGHANVSRRSDGGDAFCHDNPGSDIVPMAATGHDTIYDWHCAGRRAVPGRAVESADSLGFMARNWRPVR